MSADDLKNISKTNWERVDALTDDDIDTSDIPPLDETFFTTATVRMPPDHDVLVWFRRMGRGYQTHINAVLRTYMEARREP